MPQEFESFAPDERLTDEEVQAIVKRYGERETASGSGPTVADVAETLQVDPSTVAQMLRDIRQSQSERQLQERLNHLEMENEDLRKRASEGYVGDMFSQSHWMYRRVRRRGRRGGVVAGIIVGAFVASAGSELSFAFGPIPLIVGLVLVALFVRSIRRER